MAIPHLFSTLCYFLASFSASIVDIWLFFLMTCRFVMKAKSHSDQRRFRPCNCNLVGCRRTWPTQLSAVSFPAVNQWSYQYVRFHGRCL
ncbi:hypothetical protein GGR57DRAFT_470411 [Xylariaceae sp. FL1272]|nr:hypothetical protein GGR57DRAFT_470411 [Xylariaceae sp. FL1272]